MESNNSIISLNNCLGKEVLDITGNKCGTIRDFIINYERLNVSFVMISEGAILGSDYMIAPVNELRFDNPDAAQYALKISQRKLKEAPKLPNSGMKDKDEAYFKEIFKYYGVEKQMMRPGEISKDGYEHQSYQGSSQITENVPPDNQSIKEEVSYDKIKGNNQ